MGSVYEFGPFRLDTGSGQLQRDGAQVPIGRRAFDLLLALLRADGGVVSRDELYDAVWPGQAVEDSNLSVQIAALRKALGTAEDGQSPIQTMARRGYRFAGSVREVLGPLANAGRDLAGDGRPGIAVLPFQTLSDHPDQSWFGDGVTRELVSALARFRELFVISANSSFRYREAGHDLAQVARGLGVRYLLEGSIQRGANRVRIVANLIDAATGAQIWTDRVDGDLTDIFALQDEVTDSISGVLVARITVTERNRRAREPTARWQAYDYYLRATDPVRLQDIANFEAGWAMMEKAIELDPGFAPAYAEMAWYCLAAWLDPRCGNRFRDPATMANAWTYAQTAVRIDPMLPAAHASLGMALLWRHEVDQSLKAFARAAELNPNMADGRHGQALVIAGQPLEAIAVLRRAVRIDPHCTPIWHAFLGHAHLMLDEPEAALGPLRTCTAQMPGWRAAFVWLAATCERLGMTQEARDAATSVLRIGPSFTIGEYGRLHQYVDRPAAEVLFASLRRLGLPE